MLLFAADTKVFAEVEGGGDCMSNSACAEGIANAFYDCA